MAEKAFKLLQEQIKILIEPMGSGIASDKITVDGLPIGHMYREEPNFPADSGWRFFSGTEDQEYVDNPSNLMFYDVNTIANYDPTIIPFLKMNIGTGLEKGDNGAFRVVS